MASQRGWRDRPAQLLDQRQFKGGATSSRWRPPAHAPYQAATAPANSEAAVQKPRMTALRRALFTAVVAAVIAVSTRRSASGGAAPVSAATSRTRYDRSSGVIP